jgi:hypothetical protein
MTEEPPLGRLGELKGAGRDRKVCRPKGEKKLQKGLLKQDGKRRKSLSASKNHRSWNIFKNF